MSTDALERRVGKLEGDMTDMGKCVIRLETTQKHILVANVKSEKKQDEILEKVSDLHNGKTGVTFKWLLEKIAIPLLIGGGSAAMALFGMAKAFGWV